MHPKELKEAWNRRYLQDQQTCPAMPSGQAQHSQTGAQVSSGSQPGGVLTRDLDDDTFTFDHVNMETLTVGPYAAPIQFDAIPENVFRAVKIFYICQTCGKVFWEGSHFVRVCEQFAHVIGGEVMKQAASN